MKWSEMEWHGMRASLRLLLRLPVDGFRLALSSANFCSYSRLSTNICCTLNAEYVHPFLQAKHTLSCPILPCILYSTILTAVGEWLYCSCTFFALASNLKVQYLVIYKGIRQKPSEINSLANAKPFDPAAKLMINDWV